MWVAKLVLRNFQDPFQKAAIDCSVSALGYITSSHKIKGVVHFQGFGLVFGSEEQNKAKFIKQIKNDKFVSKIEINRDFISILIRRPYLKESDVLFNAAITFIKPIIINKDGTEMWEVASWDRNLLSRLLQNATKNYEAKILRFKQEKISSIGFMTLAPNLTSKQKTALQLAIENGYYNHPRKITLNKLAKIMKISYTTFQFHLRRAENKVMPTLISNI